MAVVTRPCLAVRLHRYPTLTLDDLASNGTIDRALQAFLAAAVRARLNLIVSGGTSAGKTTLLRALAAEIPFDERLVTIEEAQVRCTGSKLRPSSSTSPSATPMLSVPGKVAWQLERASVGLPTSNHQCTCRGVAVCQHRDPDRDPVRWMPAQAVGRCPRSMATGREASRQPRRSPA
jgi:ABC-type cobalamin/Fe3+-siderophores transport system ATPase subunit